MPDPSFTPTLVVMGPGIEAKNALPDNIKVPEGDGVIVLPGTRPEHAWYELFSPMSIYQVSNYSQPAGSPGDYYVAVYSQDQAWAYTLATGSLEEFSPSEWVMVPLDLIKVRLWQGQALLLIFGPMVVVVIAGFFLLSSSNRKRSRPVHEWLGAISGLTFLGTTATIAVQTAIALRSVSLSSDVLITMIFLAASLLLGLAAIFSSARECSARARAAMVVIGVMGLVFWSGLIIGPLLAFLAAVVASQ